MKQRIARKIVKAVFLDLLGLGTKSYKSSEFTKSWITLSSKRKAYLMKILRRYGE